MHCQNKYEISLTLKLALDLMTAFSSETGLDRFHVTCDLRGGGWHRREMFFPVKHLLIQPLI